MVYSLLRKQYIQFYSMYSEQGSQHPSSEQSYTVKCLFYLYFANFNCKKRLNPVYIILLHSVLYCTILYYTVLYCTVLYRVVQVEQGRSQPCLNTELPLVSSLWIVASGQQLEPSSWLVAKVASSYRFFLRTHLQYIQSQALQKFFVPNFEKQKPQAIHMIFMLFYDFFLNFCRSKIF